MNGTFQIRDGFWTRYQDLVCDTVIPYQRQVLADAVPGAAKSHAIQNFRIAAGMDEGAFYGWVFQDSDVAKWIEAAAYALARKPDSELEADVDALIDVISRAQGEDGYLNTYFTLGNQEKRWTNLQEAHELYCAGHMMEAAVAYFEATGKTSLLEIMRKNADCIASVFGPSKRRGFPGHPEVELALVRLYDATGERKYLELAQYFLDERGTAPNFFAEEKKARDWTVWNSDANDTAYTQNSAPVRQQKHAMGHAVRAVYLYTGMAAVAKRTGDQTLVDACRRLWDNITQKRMYVTGGIGSTHLGEAFTADYDLPNDTVYAESCASIGLIFFARQMLQLQSDSRYADAMERALYNCVLSGLSLDGKNFFYVNPLEVTPDYAGQIETHRHVLPVRPPWHGCACCPPNIARLLASLDRYGWHENEDAAYCDLFIGGEYRLSDGAIRIETEYPYKGEIRYVVQGKIGKKLALRIPAWSENWDLTVNGKLIFPEMDQGYAVLTGLRNEDEIVLNLDMTPRKCYSHVLVRENQGGVCLQRGPLVYCLEGVDNPFDLRAVRIAAEAQIRVLPKEDILGGILPLEADGYVLAGGEELYGFQRPRPSPVKLRLIPYYAWCNRGENQMTVWMKEL